MKLLPLEMKKIVTSKTYIFYVLLIFIFGFLNCQQIIDFNLNSDIYKDGEIVMNTNDKNIIRKNIIDDLETEIKSNEFKTYQFGFLKIKNLNKKELREVKDIFLKMKSSKNYNDFNKYKNAISEYIGSGSNYSEDNIHLYSKKAMNKQELQSEKQSIKNNDLYLGAYSRYYSDVMGIVLGILPFFLGAYTFLSDRKSKAFESIYPKKISSLKLISVRFITVILLSFLPVLLFSIYFVINLASVHSISIQSLLIFYKILIIWTLPIITLSSAMGMMLTILFSSFIGCIVQIFIWFINLNIGSKSIEGIYGSLYIPRHNTLFNSIHFYNNFNDFIMNRFIYFMVSIIIFIMSIYLFRIKRRGVISGGKIIRNRLKE
ncbi:hypothetical protein BHU61_10550 [Macrococcus epidermidis]|uniref:Uncharacterized protein n=1 Tax=Macrococcus epidermidis TaxID=1902580 RepID=A0A327ZNM9_9STAP|nr:hypothetical protein [Macrococcus epidermidis]RAK43983.1 hypothetical protein BHU61_10550 [Macrococcus epidermidis]